MLAGIHAGAQVRFIASISPAEIGKNEFAQLKLMVENAKVVEQITPPNLKDFMIVSGPNQESGMSIVNGVVKKFIALSFIIKPKAMGNFSIPPAFAKADGLDLRSNGVKLKVTATASGNNPGINSFNSPFAGSIPFVEPAPRSSYSDYILRKGENPLEKINKNMFVRVEVDKTYCYVGEPVIATYKLYTRLRSESNMIKNPSFNGFSVIDLQQPGDMIYKTEKLNGREYNVYIIRKAQLYPLLAGSMEIGIAEIENIVSFIKAEYINQQQDIFNDIFRDFADVTIPPGGMENHKVTLQNKPVTILVKPLPDLHKPADFKGAVGNFEAEVKIEKDNFTTDDAGKLTVIISGEGNLQMINAPEIPWPEGVEGFDSKATDELLKGTIPVSGRKIFEFHFTVAKQGIYNIPALQFSFFDSRESKYKVISTKPLQVNVTKGTGKPKKIPIEDNVRAKDNYLTKFFNNRLRVVSILTLLIITGLIIWLKRDTRKEKFIRASVIEQEEKNKEGKPDEEIMLGQQNPLADAAEYLLLGAGKLFYTELNKGLKNYLSKKFDIAPEELNKKNISEQLDKKGIANEISVQLQELMDEIEWQLYTPFVDNEKMKGINERANDLIQILNTYRG